MPKSFFTLLILSLFVILFVLTVDLTYAKTFNNDFEKGDLTDWEKTGTAFDFQPTYGDNPTARNRNQPSQHQGDWWLGLYEKYQGPKRAQSLDRALVLHKGIHLQAHLLQLSS